MGSKTIDLVFEVWESLSSLSQLLARLPMIRQKKHWPGTRALLTSRDLITPVPPHSTLARAGVWCRTLQGPSTPERRYMGIFTAFLPTSHAIDGTLLAWLMLARGLSVPSLLQVESRVSATTSRLSTPCCARGNQDCH